MRAINGSLHRQHCWKIIIQKRRNTSYTCFAALHSRQTPPHHKHYTTPDMSSGVYRSVYTFDGIVRCMFCYAELRDCKCRCILCKHIRRACACSGDSHLRAMAARACVRCGGSCVEGQVVTLRRFVRLFVPRRHRRLVAALVFKMHVQLQTPQGGWCVLCRKPSYECEEWKK